MNSNLKAKAMDDEPMMALGGCTLRAIILSTIGFHSEQQPADV